MGFNTAVMFCNDGFSQIEAHPDEFVEGIVRNYNRGGTFGVGNHGNLAQVIASEHADYTQLVAVGGNFATRVHTAWRCDHHTEDGQVAILRQWADMLGYQIARKPKR